MVANIAGIGSISLSGTSAVIAVSVVNDLYQRIEVEKNSGTKRRSTASGFFVRQTGVQRRARRHMSLSFARKSA